MILSAIGLFATICINGLPHGQTGWLCQEFQIEKYKNIEMCSVNNGKRIHDWLKEVDFLKPHLMSYRCGPADPDGDDI